VHSAGGQLTRPRELNLACFILSLLKSEGLVVFQAFDQIKVGEDAHLTVDVSLIVGRQKNPAQAINAG
jgi:hypothetical protein